ncbi:MBL fold metallo-hydrolase [Nonomuraea sp. NPDC003754]
MPTVRFSVHTAGETGLGKTSVLVAGEQQALLVDGQFTLAEQHRVLADVIDSGKHLSTVFVSAADPDYYFGLQVVRQVFPRVRVLATPDTVERIEATWRSKLEIWKQLGGNLATDVVIPEPLLGGHLELEEHVFEVRAGDPAVEWRTGYLWNAERRAVLGGAALFSGLHPWTADTPTPEEREGWRRALDEMSALEPEYVVAGHRASGGPFDASVIRFTHDYLVAFETELRDASRRDDRARALRRSMTRRYPGLGGLVNLELGAKVATGEMSWS